MGRSQKKTIFKKAVKMYLHCTCSSFAFAACCTWLVGGGRGMSNMRVLQPPNNETVTPPPHHQALRLACGRGVGICSHPMCRLYPLLRSSAVGSASYAPWWWCFGS